MNCNTTHYRANSSSVPGDPTGAKVTLTRIEERRASSSARPAAAGEPPAIEEAVRRMIAQELQRRALTHLANSDPKGEFAFDGLPPGSYRLSARAEGFAIDPPADPIEPGARVVLPAEALARVEATVLLPDGRSPERATIVFKRPPRGDASHEAWTPQDPVVTATPGTYQVSAMAAAEGAPEIDDSLVAPPQRVELVVDAAPLRLVFELRGVPLIRGKVVFPEGERRDNGAIVYALRFAGAPPEPAGLAAATGVKRAWVPARARGERRYEITDLQPGSYMVGFARGSDQPVCASQIVEVDGPVTIDFAVPALDAAKTVHLVVLDAAGAPIKHYEVEPVLPGILGGLSAGVNVVRLEDGSALVDLRGLDDEALLTRIRARLGGSIGEELAVSLAISTGEHGQRVVPLARGQRSGELVVRFDASATLDASIAGYVGGPLEGKASLTLVRAGATPEEEQRAIWGGRRRGGEDAAVDAEGRITLGPVEAGRYQVVLAASKAAAGGGINRIEISRTPIELRGGKNMATITVPPLHSLVVEATPGMSFSILGEHQTFSSGQVEVGKSGSITFELLPAGRYRLTGWATGGQTMTVNVPAPGPVKFVADAHDALHVRVTDAAGVYAQAGFEDGDLIVTLDGVEITGDEQIRLAFAQMLAKESIALTVLRSGARVELTVDPRKVFMTRGGGDIRPGRRPR